jgi:hypothetical protein
LGIRPNVSVPEAPEEEEEEAPVAVVGPDKVALDDLPANPTMWIK